MERGHSVVGIDNLNDYYDPALKQARLARLDGRNNFTFCRLEVQDSKAVPALAGEFPDIIEIVHMAAKAGVRYSIEIPFAYDETNMRGTPCIKGMQSRQPKSHHYPY